MSNLRTVAARLSLPLLFCASSVLAQSSSTRYVALLDGPSVAPCSVPGTGSGVAVCYLHRPSNVLVFDITASGLVGIALSAVFGHAAGGACGPPVFTLLPAGAASDTWSGRLQLTPGQVGWLDAGEIFVQVHSAGFVTGQMRGQLLRREPAVFTADLLPSGMPAPVPASRGYGHACFALNLDNSLAYIVRASAVTGTAAAYLDFPAPAGGFTSFLLSASAATTWLGNTPVLGAAQIMSLTGGGVRVRVATTGFPLGEIADLAAAGVRPVVLGTACAGVGGRIAEIGADTLPCVGNCFRPLLYNGTASSPAFLFLSLSTGYTDLGIFGITGCGAYVTLPPIVTYATATDANGRAAGHVCVPYDRSFLGMSIYAQWLFAAPGVPRPLEFATSNALHALVQ